VVFTHRIQVMGRRERGRHSKSWGGGKVKASRPLIHVLVINDNLGGLTISLRI
jgi:hypothetical protein